MRRREFIGVVASASALWSRSVCAQQGGHASHRRAHELRCKQPGSCKGVLRRFGRAFSSWDGSRIATCGSISAGVLATRTVRQYAAELVALSPDVVLAAASSVLGPLLQATRTIPIVFAQVIDPVGAGYVSSLARPGGNATGFTNFDFTLSGKWLELLKEVAPGVTRVAAIRNPTVATGIGQFAAIQVAAASLRISLHPFDVRSAGDIERALTSFADEPGSGLLVIQGATGSIAKQSSPSPLGTACLRFIPFATSSLAAG